jgi:spermidine/putrescine transport system permease protein
MEKWSSRPAAFAFFSLPTLGWLLAFFLFPLAIVWRYSFGENTSIVDVEFTGTLDNYARIFQPEILTLMWRTLWMSLVSTAICIAVGYILAMVIASAGRRWKPWLLLLIMLPFWTNLLIRTYALLNILGTRGRLNQALAFLHDTLQSGLQLVGLEWLIAASYKPITFLGTPFGVIFGLVYIMLPFSVLPIYASLERIDKSCLEASLDLGAGQLRTFFLVLVPMTMGGLITAVIITFVPTLGQFLTPDLLGRGQVDMIANVIERQFKKANDWPFGSALSLFLLYITFVLLAIKSIYDMRQSRQLAR